MILKPQQFDNDETVVTLGFKESYDELWGRNFNKKRIACNNNGDVRIEDLAIFPDDNYLIKMCTFGKKYVSMMDFNPKSNSISKERIDVKNHMYTTIDLKSGKCEQWGSHTRSPLYSSTDYWFDVGELDFTNYPQTIYLSPKDKMYNTSKLRHCFLGFDLNDIQASIYGTENSLQIGYTKCVGLLTSFFTQWSYSIPFDSFVIIDTDKGFNVPIFKYLNIFGKNVGKMTYAKYVNAISNVFEILKRNCEYEKKHLRINIFTSAYTTVIKIHDKQQKGFTMDFNLNASDHFNSIMANVESEGYDWGLSEECGTMMSTDNYNITDEMIQAYNVECESIC